MPLVYSALLPHPKYLLQKESTEIKKIPKTATSFEMIKKRLQAENIHTLIMINANPVAPIDPYSPPLAAPDVYAYFGLDKLITSHIPEVATDTLVFNNDLDLMHELQNRARPLGLKVVSIPQIKMDGSTSTVAQLLVLEEHKLKINVIHLPYKDLAPLSDFGTLLGSVLKDCSEKIALIGIGNLSARLTKDSPAGFKPDGAAFDNTIQEAAQKNDFSKLLSMSPEDLEAAGQEAALPLAVMAAASSKLGKSKLLSYEDGLGVGYGIISWAP